MASMASEATRPDTPCETPSPGIDRAAPKVAVFVQGPDRLKIDHPARVNLADTIDREQLKARCFE
jgi:hypothetical protein